MEKLKEIGFEKAGHWYMMEGQLQIELNDLSSEKKVLYCFATTSGEIKYIGKTTTTVAQRLYRYRKPSISQRTNFRVNKKIIEFLGCSKELEIYVLKNNELLRIGTFPLNIAAGLEDTLIEELMPDWNETGKSIKSAKKEYKAFQVDKTLKNKERISTNSFNVKIGSAYYHNGFFNVRKQYSKLFGDHGSLITINIPEQNNQSVHARINRTANKNGTPRIMAGTEFKNWIQNKYNQGEQFLVRIINANHIIIK